MNNLRNRILTAPWMMDRSMAESYLPDVARLLNGENVKFREEPAPKPYAFTAQSARKIKYSNFSQAPEGSVAVYPIIGAVTKYSGWCNMGTEDLMLEMSKADELPNISAHLLEIDSGGGEGTNIETVARFIRNGLKKPVIAWFNGYCASAAYYLAAAADEIYASQGNDIVGSVGVMISFFDFQKFYEEKGIQLHEIYASQSDLKNKDFKDAKEGNYEAIQKKMLDPFADQFIKDVKTYRSALSEKDAFRGAVFSANEAIEIQMIDGLKTFDQTVDRAIELSKNTQNQIDMTRIETAIGYELEKQADGSIFLQAEEVQKLNAKLVGEGEQVVQTTQLDEALAKVDALSEQVGSLKNQVLELETASEKMLSKADFENFKTASAAPPTTAFTTNSNAIEADKAAGMSELERITNEAAATGSTLRVTD